MTDVLIYADTIRSPEMRHEVPVPVPDPFLYAERDGRRQVAVTSFEVERLHGLEQLEVAPWETFGLDELLRDGLPRRQADLEALVRACREFGVVDAVVPGTFPLEVADHLRANGISLRADDEAFRARRRVKSAPELEGIRRAQRAAEAGMAAAVELFRRAEPRNGGLVVDGEPLTCERVKLAVEQAFGRNGATAEEFIVSHGAQTAVGHEMGHGAIAPDEPIVLDLFPRDRESGCFADMTRTFVIGTPSEELREYHRLSREALERALAAIKPGIAGSELHRQTCEFFHQHGHRTQLSKQPGEVLQDGFFHSLGHGVGLEVHEQPSLGRNGQELIPGDVVSVEPGLYRSGYGGVRLEDLVLVTEDGAENLTQYPYDLAP